MCSNLESFVVDLVLINLIFENFRPAEAEPIGNIHKAFNAKNLFGKV